MTKFHHAAVLGFGTMGAGIAQVLAQAGLEVTVFDIDETRLADGRRRMSAMLDGGVARGKLDAVERDRILDTIRATTEVADLASSDLVVEAVAEVLDTKVDVLSRVAAVVGSSTVLATNTSALAVTDIAASVPGPERVAGLHFFNPVPVMGLVEVVRGLQTSGDVVTRLLALGAQLGKVAIEAPDRPGFLVNRLLMPYLNDVIQAYDDGLASAEDIDQALELGLGYPRGPLALLDLIGLDVHQHATYSAYKSTLDPQFAPPPLLRRMVAAGRLGVKSGRGFVVGTGGAR
ncbi:3-hydroxyacyl-CoA dehydrogenase family protein [Jatrophihabitans cynanchi]|uniref:3-hydroxyacyl-CoA dehydrogenase family protein n=1 Tax=Jatrophihabitans cynanchi TaxID=2944128 RepID=A0ABY7K0L0_9ACTN|nr:3-hydroxyacyl-CoA dehydrogenase family protein [Jatrophihabitans sp. SB3-54]WAX58389.1 3-hydroxyacyl-CoA dehydrogenase family protein [Jatrophihabitans sp. SB3-54]